MRDRDVDARGKGPGRAVAANGAAAVGRKRRQRKTRRRWSAEEKVRIARESFASGETVTAVARRHGMEPNRLSAWRSLLRRGKLSAPPPSKAQPRGAFAAVEVEERSSVLIEGRGVTVRLEGIADAAGIASIAAALAGRRR